MGWYYDYKPYVPVAQRRAQAAREVERRRKAGQKITPVVIDGRNIARSFWGLSWCKNLERYSDYANRLPRGRTYVRNGSVVDLQIARGKITALVSGSELYTVKIEVAPLPKARWKAFKERCGGAIGSLVELLQGKLSKEVMALATDPGEGLFPSPRDIKLSCSCPDGASMCKHVAAVMYGVGNRLDHSPELLFVLRDVNHEELIEQALPAARTTPESGTPSLAPDDLGSIFGIEIETTTPAAPAPAKSAAAPKKGVKAVATAKKAVPTTPRKAATTKPTAKKAAPTAAKTSSTAAKTASTKGKANTAGGKPKAAGKTPAAAQQRPVKKAAAPPPKRKTAGTTSAAKKATPPKSPAKPRNK